MLTTMALGIFPMMIQLFMSMRMLSHLKKYRLTGRRVPPKFLIGYAVVGLVGITYGVSFVLRSISAYVWEGVILFPLFAADGIKNQLKPGLCTAFNGGLQGSEFRPASCGTVKC